MRVDQVQDKRESSKVLRSDGAGLGLYRFFVHWREGVKAMFSRVDDSKSSLKARCGKLPLTCGHSGGPEDTRVVDPWFTWPL